MDVLNGLIISAHPPHPKPPLPITLAYYDVQLNAAFTGAMD
jgi:hypothetical protein